MSDDWDLRGAIEAKVRQWHDSSHRPPVTTAHLVAMALAVRTQPATMREVMKWLADNFRYFHELVFDSFWSSVNPRKLHGGSLGDEEAYKRASAFAEGVRFAFSEYDLPITSSESKDGEEIYSISSIEARIFLENTLGLGRPGTFPFLSLPVDIRVMIYDMVFAFPQSGIAPRRDNSFEILTRDFQTPFRMIDWLESVDSTPLRGSPLRRTLSLGLVCKQLAQESTSRFFNINTFFCHDVHTLGRLLSQMPQVHCNQLRHIAFKYDFEEADWASLILRELASLSKLRRLHIAFDERLWCRLQKQRNLDMSRVPGIASLARVIGLQEVTFHGHCPTITAFMESEMQKTKRPHQVVVRMRSLHEN